MKLHWYKGVFIFLLLMMWMKSSEVVAITETKEYTIIYYENEISLDCVVDENGILLIPLHKMLDFLGCEYTECGRCGKDEVWNEKINDPKGWAYVNWNKNILTYSGDQTVVVLDAENIKIDGTTYTSQMVYSYLGYGMSLDEDSKRMEVTDITWNEVAEVLGGNPGTNSNTFEETMTDEYSPVISQDNTQLSTPFVYVYDPYCSSCKGITSLIDEIEQSYDNEMLRLDASTKLNINEIKEYEETSKVPEALQDVYPALYFGDQYLINKEITVENIQKLVNGERIVHNIVDGAQSSDVQIQETSMNYIKSLIYFYTSTCGACLEVSSYLNEIKVKYPEVIVTEHNLYEAENIKLLKTYGKGYGVKEEQIGEIPAVFISDQYLIGEDEINEQLVGIIEEYNVTKPTVELQTDEILMEDDILHGFAVFGAGLLNGINPCSLSMFLFLASLMMLDRKKILKIGISFCIGKFAMFFLLGTLFYQIISYISMELMNFITKSILFLLIVILAVLNINDYRMARAEKYNKMVLQLPSWLKGFNHKIMKKTAKYIDSKYLIFIMFLLGMLLAFGEFMCTGQIYLASIVLLIQESQMEWMAILYLWIYCIAFILPLLIMTLLVYFGRKVFHLSDIVLRRLPLIKLISSLLFILFGIYLLLQ